MHENSQVNRMHLGGIKCLQIACLKHWQVLVQKEATTTDQKVRHRVHILFGMHYRSNKNDIPYLFEFS